jgi:hypothetical protein
MRAAVARQVVPPGLFLFPDRSGGSMTPQIVPCSESIRPEELLRLATAIERQLGGRVRDLRLTCEGVGIILSGNADSYYAKQLAQHCIMTTRLRIVSNRIVVA